MELIVKANMQAKQGDTYIPSLIGVSFTNKIKSLDNLENFNYSHSYVKGMPNLSEDELKKLKIILMSMMKF